MRRFSLALCFGLAALSATADDEVAVPGGPASVRRLFGLDPGRPSDVFFLDLHEFLLFESAEDTSWSAIETRRRAVEFARDLTEWRRLFGSPASFTPAPGAEWLRCERALDWLGFRVRGKGLSFVAERRPDPTSVRRQSFLDVLGTPTTAFLGTLHAGKTATIMADEGSAPLPFGLPAWRETVSAPELTSANAFLFFVKNVRASRMLVALHRLDPDTREELLVLLRDAQSRPMGWRVLYQEVLDPFYRYPGALRIRDGRFLLPGGAQADPIWADLFGVGPSERSAFLRALYKTDGGKAAYVVDVLQHLREETARQLLFGRSEDGAGAVRRFRRLYRLIDPHGENHGLTHRDPYDFAHLAALLGASPETQLAPAPGPGAVDAPHEQTDLASLLPNQARTALLAEESEGPFLDRSAGKAGDVAAQRRFVFLSSLLADHPMLADPSLRDPLERGLDRYLPAYAVFEDIPFSRPELTRRYLSALDRLERREPSPQARVAAGLFQGAVELLARATRAGTLHPGEAERLLAELLEIPLFAREDASLARSETDLFAWLSGRFLPALRTGVRRETADSDELIERALAGPPMPTPVQWRGGRYHFDPTDDEVVKQHAFRDKQRLTWVADLEVLHRERVEVEAALARGDLEAAKAAAAELARDLELEGQGPAETSDAADARAGAMERRAREAAAEIAAISGPGGLPEVSARLPAFDGALAERHLEALLGHVYAAGVKDPNDLYYQDPLFVRRHSFRTFAPGGVAVRTAFTRTVLVQEGGRGGSRVAGSLFGLTDVLALLHADQLSYRPGARVPNDATRTALVAPIWAMSAARLNDDSLQVVADSCEATRQLAAALSPLPSRDRLSIWDALARDLVPRSRLWLLAASEGGADPLSVIVSPSDLYRIGRRLSWRAPAEGIPPLPAALRAREAMERLTSRYGESGARIRLAEFGPLAPSYAGRYRLADMDMPPYERLAAYRRPEILSERLYDVKVAVACRVAEAGLPAAVLPIVLPAAVDQMLSELRMAYPYDWNATTRAAAAFSSGDLDRIVDEAVRDGRLVRDDSPSAPKAGS